MKFFLRLFLILIFLSCSKKESQDLKELIYNVKFDVSGNGTIDKDSGSYNLTNSFSVTATPEEGNYFDHQKHQVHNSNENLGQKKNGAGHCEYEANQVLSDQLVPPD